MTAGAIAFLLGTLGSFMVGFGVMTGCTNTYDCTETSCSPCSATSRWLGAGAATQTLVVLAVIAVLVTSGTARVRHRMLPVGVILLTVSVLSFAVTSRVASGSY